MRRPVQSFVWTAVILIGTMGVLVTSVSAAPGTGTMPTHATFQAAPLTFELCDSLDANNDGMVGRDEEDGLRENLPDLDGDGEAIGSQSDQDVAVAGCTAVLAEGDPDPPTQTPFDELLIAQLITLLLALLAGLTGL